MPLLRINTDGTDWTAPDGPDALRRALDGLSQGAPVIAMVHGYKFTYRTPAHSPHGHILSLAPARAARKVPSWPRALGFGRGDPHEGLAIAFGWHARGRVWHAYDRAGQAGRVLARLLDEIAWHRGAPAHLVGHSLGACVALSALAHAAPGSLGRLVLLAGAEFDAVAEAAMAAPAGRLATVLNITSRENDLFDFLLERLVAPTHLGARAIGHGLSRPSPRWTDLQIDHPDIRATLAAFGYPIPAADRRICHWSAYLRPGLFELYRAYLRAPDDLLHDMLHRAAAPAMPRWSRLLGRPGRADPWIAGQTVSS